MLLGCRRLHVNLLFSSRGSLKTTSGLLSCAVANRVGLRDVTARCFFNELNPLNSNKRGVYSERRVLGYTMEQMYKIAAEVQHYKEFLPYCRKSTVFHQQPGFCKCSLEIGFPPFVEKYTSIVTLIKPHQVKSVCTDGTLFNYLEADWRFSPGPELYPGTCNLNFRVSEAFCNAKV